MATATHGYVNTTSCTCWDVNAYNRAGVYATADIDNGVCVVLNGINKDSTTNVINGYEYNVTPATAESTSVWIVDSPEVGYSPEAQLYDDPRYFTNEAGKPMSIKYLQPIVDVIEVDANAFVAGALPTTEGFVTIGAGGKYVPAAAAPAGNVPYFTVEGFHSVAIGGTEMPTVLLAVAANY